MSEKTYVIGTHDAEIERLGVQHRVWRASVLDLWRVAGLTHGMTVLDAGAGPGHASIDLAELVGPPGRVIAVERSRRFLDALCARTSARGIANIEPVEADLLDYDWPTASVDHVWCRWVLAFVSDPAAVVRGMARALKPGGALMIQEYYDYGAWHMAPSSSVFDDYVSLIVARWRASGGNADIGLELPAMLADAGLVVEVARPVVFAAGMNDFIARWPMGFAHEYLPVLEQAGALSPEKVAEIRALLAAYDSNPDAIVLTPGVLQIVARKT